MPRALPDEILEEVLRRLPPQEPAMLVRAALVSRRWCRLVSGPGFRRRFREFHRRPSILGMLSNYYTYDLSSEALFLPTTAFCAPRKNFSHMSVLDARHGRVLFSWYESFIVVWDPIADKRRELRLPHNKKWNNWTAAVLCSAAAAGDCDHLDCHQGPFIVVFVSSSEDGSAVVYTYSSDATAWSECVCSQQQYSANSWPGSALVGNSLYFGSRLVGTALKYDLELRQVSLVQLPSLWCLWTMMRESRLTTMEGDGGLGLVNVDDSKLYMWSRKDTPEVDAEWESRVIELKTVFPVHVDVSSLGVIGSGVGIILMRTENGREVYAMDLKTYEVKKVQGGSSAEQVIPYMSFYTPALKEVRNPSTGGSSA